MFLDAIVQMSIQSRALFIFAQCRSDLDSSRCGSCQLHLIHVRCFESKRRDSHQKGDDDDQVSKESCEWIGVDPSGRGPNNAKAWIFPLFSQYPLSHTSFDSLPFEPVCGRATHEIGIPPPQLSFFTPRLPHSHNHAILCSVTQS